MLQAFKTHINQNLSFLKKSKLLIAISGGVDSVVLTHLCHQLKLNFALAHCNFNLRGKESQADEDFVLQLADDLEVEIFIQNFDTKAYIKQHKTSIQMAARELRYNWFKELAAQLHYDYILTAHHADDNVETFLINFLRGTGLNGLTGIPMVNENVVRPLLPFGRQTIETYANQNQLKWREDASNSNRKYLRNKLRHDVLPILKEINPQLLSSFQNTLNYLNDTASIVTDRLQAIQSKIVVTQDENSSTYNISALKNLNNPKAYLFQLFGNYGFTEWDNVLQLLDAESGKKVCSNTHQLTKHREYLILSALCNSELDHTENEAALMISKTDTSIKTPIGILKIEAAETLPKNHTKNIAYVDAETLNFPLELRPWKTEDVFYPLNLKGKKKLSKFLKDEHLTPFEKNQVWVLCSNNQVVWVVNYRLDNRFKITENTKQILKITVIKP